MRSIPSIRSMMSISTHTMMLLGFLLVVLIPCTGVEVWAQTSASADRDQPILQQDSWPQREAEAVAREQLDQILSEPIFHRWELAQQSRNEMEGAWFKALMNTADRWGERVYEWLRSIFPRTPKPLQLTPGVSWAAGGAFKIIACVLGGLLLVFIIIVIVRVLRAPAQPATTRILSRKRLQEALQQGHALATDSSQWITEAMRLAQDNDLRLAYRAMYLALLSGLHQQRSIDYHQQRTNWTYVEHFRGEADRKKSFAGLTDMFDAVWYGLGQPEAAKLQEVRNQIDSLLTPPARREGK